MKRKVLGAVACALVFLASGCATRQSTLVRKNDGGPVAFVADSNVSSGKGPTRSTTFFTLAEVDGSGALRTSIDRTRTASQGQGFRQTVVGAHWTLDAGPARLKLVGRVTYGAPIQELFAGSRLRSIEGEVEVDLKPDRRYVVNGVLDAYRSEIWLEDADSREVIGTKVVRAPDAAALARSTASGTFTCCNLHYDEKLITDENFTTEWPVIEAGARVAVLGFHGSSADVIVEGRPMVFDVYVGNDVRPTKIRPQDLADRYAVAENPRLKIATYAPDVQRAVRAGKVMPGMTREQVIISLGYPWPTKTPTLDSKRWSYFATHEDEDEYVVVWGDDGTVATVEARPAVKAMVVP